MSVQFEKWRHANWYIAVFAGVCNILSVLQMHYENYVYYTVRMHGKTVLGTSWDINDLILLLPTAFVMIVRQSTPIVFTYASILSLILMDRLYLLLPGSLTGIHGPSKTMDFATASLTFLGVVSGLGLFFLGATVLFSFLTDRGNQHNGNN